MQSGGRTQTGGGLDDRGVSAIALAGPADAPAQAPGGAGPTAEESLTERSGSRHNSERGLGSAAVASSADLRSARFRARGAHRPPRGIRQATLSWVQGSIWSSSTGPMMPLAARVLRSVSALTS